MLSVNFKEQVEQREKACFQLRKAPLPPNIADEDVNITIPDIGEVRAPANEIVTGGWLSHRDSQSSQVRRLTPALM